MTNRVTVRPNVNEVALSPAAPVAVTVAPNVYQVSVTVPEPPRVTVTRSENRVTINSVGIQGPPGPEGQVGPEGPPGPGNDIVLGEEPTGVINGSNATFTTDHAFVPGTVVVRVNGLSQRLVTDFQTSGTNTITLTDSPQPGDHLAVDYERA